MAFLAPQQVSGAFAHALSAGDLDAAGSLFAPDACFVTPDATAIHGTEGIRAVLTQLTASRAQLEVMPNGMHTAGGLALCHERWTFSYDRTAVTPLARTSDATVLLRRRSTAWELLTVAPWGLADGDRHPFLSAALEEIRARSVKVADRGSRWVTLGGRPAAPGAGHG